MTPDERTSHGESSAEEFLSDQESTISNDSSTDYEDATDDKQPNESGPYSNTNCWCSTVFLKLIQLFPDRNSVMNWCIQTGLVGDYRICPNCNSSREWKYYADGLEYWKCKEETSNCEKIPVNEKTSFVYEGVRMDDLVTLFYMWWVNRSMSDRVEHNKLSLEDNDHFDATLREICIFGCKKESRRIGGRNVAVNVEIGLRMGTSCQTQIFIGGFEADHCTSLFLAHFCLENKSSADIKDFIIDWIDPSSDVSTKTAILYPFEDLCWKEKEKWTLEFNTGCLAEDLWRQRLLCAEKPFEELVKTVSEYFGKSKTIVGHDFVFDTNQVNINELSKSADVPNLDLTVNPWEFDPHDCIFI